MFWISKVLWSRFLLDESDIPYFSILRKPAGYKMDILCQIDHPKGRQKIFIVDEGYPSLKAIRSFGN